MKQPHCRHCQSPLEHTVLDLGHQPPSNAYLKKEQLSLPETTYPLKVFLCTDCWLMQLPEHAAAEDLFTADYAYFSSTSRSWCSHAKQLVEKAISRLGLGPGSHVVEIASNDGYLLQYVQEHGIPCLGIEPTHSTAEKAMERGIPTLQEFFSENLARELEKADFVVANNVLAHVPNVNDFMLGIATILKPNGAASIEFPHILKMIEGNQFDTIYHEHYSYFGLHNVIRIAEASGLEVMDVEEIKTHGGSLRVWLQHKKNTALSSVTRKVLGDEEKKGLGTRECYSALQRNAEKAKNLLLEFLIRAKQEQELVLGYGAAAKGNTLLNYAGIKSDLLPAVADRAESKQGKYLPGSHIPIISPESLKEQKVDTLLVLPWNILDEVMAENKGIAHATAIPTIERHGSIN